MSGVRNKATDSLDPAKVTGQLKRLVISQGDMLQAAQFVELLLRRDYYGRNSQDEKVERLALETALVVSYSRPFAPSRRTSGTVPSAPVGDPPAALDTDEKRLHDRILRLRSAVFAHSDAEEHDVQLETVAMPEIGIRFLLPLSRNPYVVFERRDIEIARRNISTMLERMNEKRRELEALLESSA